MRKHLILFLCLPLLAASPVSNQQAVIEVINKMIAGEILSNEILDRQIANKGMPDLDTAISLVPGCRVGLLDRLTNGSYAVKWRCKGRKKNEHPSTMMIYITKGQVTKITTAIPV